ncbi:MAG: hypothetical protein H0W07_09660 [Chloroflexi bacterium]|nr:hypothetical protein [Chloroflexota bacterium]
MRAPTSATTTARFLRGQQVTDTNGLAQFTTIVPGWYQGRAVHVHFKVRADEAASGTLEFTSQLFFEDTLVDEVHARTPYAAKGQRTIRNADDGIFRDGGDVLLLDLIGDAGSGYSASFDIGLRPA